MDPELGLKMGDQTTGLRGLPSRERGAGIRSGPAGFTLLEVVIVAGLLAFLAVGVGVALRPSGAASRSVAEDLVSAYFERARTAAILHGTPVRVLVRDEPSAAADHRRQIGAVRRVHHPTEFWQAIDEGLHLPTGVVWGSLEAGADPASGRMRLEYPRGQPVPSGSGGFWWFVEIGPDGCLSRPLVVSLARVELEPGTNARAPLREPPQRLGVRRCAGVVKLGSPEAPE